MEAGDEAIWDYIAQSILRNQIPYRDVIEIKTPACAYLSAAAIATGRLANLPDPISVRLLNCLLVGSLAATCFLTSFAFLQNRSASVLASLIPLAPAHFSQWMVSGSQPKLPMTVFGLLSLLLIAKDRPFWAGLFSMLSFLCWQPGLLFFLVALLAFPRFDIRLLKLMVGALIPLVLLLFYFHLLGALVDLYNWTFAFNLLAYAPETFKGLSEGLALIWKVSRRVFGPDMLLVALSLAGLIAFGIERFRRKFKSSEAELRPFKDALMMSPIIYLAFCLINFQSGPDLIPLFPFIGIFAGWLMVRVVSLAGPAFKLLPIAALTLILALIFYRSMVYKYGYAMTLSDQYKKFEAISDMLGPDDKIYVHGAAELLVLTGRSNLNPYIFLDRGKDNFISAKRPGGFKAIIEDMEKQSPKVVALARLAHVAHRLELEQWVKERYTQLEQIDGISVYIRK
jgi:hypothetical protein